VIPFQELYLTHRFICIPRNTACPRSSLSKFWRSPSVRFDRHHAASSIPRLLLQQVAQLSLLGWKNLCILPVNLSVSPRPRRRAVIRLVGAIKFGRRAVKKNKYRRYKAQRATTAWLVGSKSTSPFPLQPFTCTQYLFILLIHSLSPILPQICIRRASTSD
jgi:hypothetical protein